MNDAGYVLEYFVAGASGALIRVDLGPDGGESEAIAFRDKFHPGCSLYKQELWHKYTEVV